jgi:hypothetical protein
MIDYLDNLINKQDSLLIDSIRDNIIEIFQSIGNIKCQETVYNVYGGV